MQDLGVEQTRLEVTLDKVLRYIFAAPITIHCHSSIMHFLHASAVLPPDVSFLCVAFGVLMLQYRVKANRKHRSAYCETLSRLSGEEVEFACFELDQDRPHRNVNRFINFFLDEQLKLSSVTDIEEDHFGIDPIIEWVKGRLSHRSPRSDESNWASILLSYPESPSADESEFLVFDDTESELTSVEPLPSPRTERSPTPTSARPENANIDRSMQELVKLFLRWPTAYEGSKQVWKLMEKGPFDLDRLIHLIPLSFADYLTDMIGHFQVSGGPVD
jgi:hypothetical protein